MSKFKKEPAVIIGAGAGVVGALLTLAAALGYITDAQAGGAASMLAGLTGLIIRQFVYSPAGHELEVNLAEAHAADAHASIDGDEPAEASYEPDDFGPDSQSVSLTAEQFDRLLERAGMPARAETPYRP